MELGEFIQLSSSEHQAPAGNATPVTFNTVPEPVVDEATPSVQWKKCADGSPNCGLLHDLMAMQWGKFKDLVDELEHEMQEKEDAWEDLKDDMNAQIDDINDEKA